MVTLARVFPFMLAMAVVVTASNVLVRYPFDHFGLAEVLTYGAFTYPFAFLVTDLCNRRHGLGATRQVVCFGFAAAVLLSIFLATPRIAIASGTAFLVAQLVDAQVFDRLRRAAWWQAPLVSTLAGSALDTILFFTIAFAAGFAFLDTATGSADGSLAMSVPFFASEAPLWVVLALGDFVVKIATGFAMLAPYGAFLKTWKRSAPAASQSY